MEIVDGIKIYTCPICKESFPEISNSAPYKDGAPCISCYFREKRGLIVDEQISKHCKTTS